MEALGKCSRTGIVVAAVGPLVSKNSSTLLPVLSRLRLQEMVWNGPGGEAPPFSSSHVQRLFQGAGQLAKLRMARVRSLLTVTLQLAGGVALRQVTLAVGSGGGRLMSTTLTLVLARPSTQPDGLVAMQVTG